MPDANGKKSGALRALLLCKTVEEAAKMSCVSKPTLFRWLREDQQFHEEYENACSQLMDETLMQLRVSCRKSVETLSEVMADCEAAPASRVTAARATLELTLKIEEHRALVKRLELLETRMKERQAQPAGFFDQA
jgi:hypothetical protein